MSTWDLLVVLAIAGYAIHRAIVDTEDQPDAYLGDGLLLRNVDPITGLGTVERIEER